MASLGNAFSFSEVTDRSVNEQNKQPTEPILGQVEKLCFLSLTELNWKLPAMAKLPVSDVEKRPKDKLERKTGTTRTHETLTVQFGFEMYLPY